MPYSFSLLPREKDARESAGGHQLLRAAAGLEGACFQQSELPHVRQTQERVTVPEKCALFQSLNRYQVWMVPGQLVDENYK